MQLFEAIDTPTYVYLVMEYVKGESLHSFLKRTQSRRMPEDQIKIIMKQLFSILQYLHSQNVTHRDVKLENILIDRKSLQIKLIDFGFCCHSDKDQLLKIFCGTPSYMAPEIVNKTEYKGPPTDVWAAGVLCYAMLCGAFPFRGATDRELYSKISVGKLVWPEHLSISKEARHFVEQMIEPDVRERHTTEQLSKSAWLGFSGDFLSTEQSSGGLK